MIAAYVGRVRPVEQLLAAGARVNDFAHNGSTYALLEAAIAGRKEVVAQLIKAGAKVVDLDDALKRVKDPSIAKMLKSTTVVTFWHKLATLPFF